MKKSKVAVIVLLTALLVTVVPAGSNFAGTKAKAPDYKNKSTSVNKPPALNNRISAVKLTDEGENAVTGPQIQAPTKANGTEYTIKRIIPRGIDDKMCVQAPAINDRICYDLENGRYIVNGTPVPEKTPGDVPGLRDPGEYFKKDK